MFKRMFPQLCGFEHLLIMSTTTYLHKVNFIANYFSSQVSRPIIHFHDMHAHVVRVPYYFD